MSIKIQASPWTSLRQFIKQITTLPYFRIRNLECVCLFLGCQLAKNAGIAKFVIPVCQFDSHNE